MFRVNGSEGVKGFSPAQRFVQGSLLLALVISCVAALESWRLGAGLPFCSSLVVSAILLVCIAALWWLRRRFLLSQQSLRHVKMLAHDILASTDRGVVTTDCAGTITSINSAGIRLLEVDSECVGRPLASVCRPDLPLRTVFREVVEGRVAVRDRDFNVDRAGRVLRLRVDGHALSGTDGTALGCVIHLRDVTERMLLEERMRRMERFLGLATLASGLHHEIKNPLTALSIHIQLLEESLAGGPTGEPADELVGVLKTEVCRLNGVLESFRSFASLQHLSLQPTDALGVVEDTIRLIRPQAAEQGVQITLLHPERELPRVPLDAEKFEQAVLNLAINALEAMPGGGHLTFSAAVAGDGLRVAVKDSGPGIPPEAQKSLFQPYFSTKSGGTGMGLALTEKLVGQHGGQIEYHTGPGGSTFEITIPLGRRNGAA